MRFRFTIAAVGAAALLAACSHVPWAPVITDTVKRDGQTVGTLATIAQRRLVLVRMDTNGTVFCAEPPPDAVDNITRSFGGSLSMAETKELQSTLALLSKLETKAEALFSRSQGVEFFRHGLYALCQNSANGKLTDANLDSNLNLLINKAAEIIKMELPHLYRTDAERSGEAPDAKESCECNASDGGEQSAAAPRAPAEPKEPRKPLPPREPFERPSGAGEESAP